MEKQLRDLSRVGDDFGNEQATWRALGFCFKAHLPLVLAPLKLVPWGRAAKPLPIKAFSMSALSPDSPIFFSLSMGAEHPFISAEAAPVF